MGKNKEKTNIIEFKKPGNNENTNKSRKNKKQNNFWKRIKKWLAALGIGTAATALAISAGEATKINETEIEKPIDDEFKENLKKGVKVKTDVEKEIEGLETSEDVLAYLKKSYIEDYKNKTGDTSLTTEDIEIRFEDSLNYAYIINGETEETEKIVLHGELPYETENKLKEQGKKYDVANNLGKTIIVTKKGEDKIIDGAVKSNDYNKVLNVVEPEGKSLGIIKDNWEKYIALINLYVTLEEPTSNKYIEDLAIKALKNATNEGKNTNKGESITPKEIDEGR